MIFVLWYAIMQCPRDFHSQKKRERKKTKTNSWDKWRSPNGWDDGSPKRAGEDKRANLDSYTCTHKRTLATWIHVSSREGDQGAYTWESHSLRCSDKGPADCMATMWAWWMDLKHFRDLWSNPFFIRNDLTILLLTCSGCTGQLTPTYSMNAKGTTCRLEFTNWILQLTSKNYAKIVIISFFCIQMLHVY